MADMQKIVDGPNLWSLVIDGLAKRGREGSAVIFKVNDRKQRVEYKVLIACLRSGQPLCWEHLAPADVLGMQEMERALGNKFDWDNAWWFQGSIEHFPAIQCWGLYSPVSRKGIIGSQYIGA